MDAEFAKWLATLGVGGALAGVIFMFYRKDVKMYTDLWKSQSEMLMRVVSDNTAALARLVSAIEALHRRDDYIEDALERLGAGFPRHRHKERDRQADSTPQGG